MLSLLKSERFQTEYKELTARIGIINDADVKNRASKLLEDLVKKVKEFDMAHMDMIATRQNLTDMNTERDKVMVVRRQLVKLLDDWQKTTLKSK